MPRNASGTYSLPSGNPVSSGTLIDSNWANNTLNDLANEVTDSLSRSAEGGMLAPLRLTDGVQATPSLAFTNEPSTGLYRAGTNEAWFVTGGNQVAKFTSTGMDGRFAAGAAATPSLAAYNDVNTGLWFPAADTLAASTGGSERLRVDSGGNILVGTGTAGNARFLVRGPGTTSATASIEGATSGGATRFLVSDDGLCRWYGTSNAETMRLDNAGNLGIGTASPTSKLQVVGASLFQAPAGNFNIVEAASGGAGGLQFFRSGFNNWYVGSANSSTGFAIGEGSTLASPALFFASGGNLGIGTASPGYRLDVVDAGGNALRFGTSTVQMGGFVSAGLPYFGTISNHSLALMTNSVERMRIDSSGNIVAGASAALATNATNGFLYVPTCAGTPTGTPTAITGMAPIVVNTTNNKLYFYSGGAWRDAGP